MKEPIAQIQIRHFLNKWEKFREIYSHEEGDASLAAIKDIHPGWQVRLVFADEKDYIE